MQFGKWFFQKENMVDDVTFKQELSERKESKEESQDGPSQVLKLCDVKRWVY